MSKRSSLALQDWGRIYAVMLARAELNNDYTLQHLARTGLWAVDEGLQNPHAATLFLRELELLLINVASHICCENEPLCPTSGC